MAGKPINANGAGSGVPKRAKRRSGRRGRKSQRRPRPASAADVRPASQPVESQPLDGLLNLFPSQPAAASQPESVASSASSGSLSADAQAALDSVPEVIAAPVDAAAEGPEAELTSEDVRELMAQVAFEEQDVRDLLAELFDWLADRFDSDHWKLTERQMRILGGPSFRLANVLWKRLEERLPDILIGWCESTPGAAALIMACGIVVGPKIAKQVRLSRGGKRAQPAQTELDTAMGRKSPAPQPPGSPHIPVAAGIITQ